MRYIKSLGIISLLVLLVACSDPNPNCHNKGGQCWELSIEGVGMSVDVGEEKRVRLSITVYQNGVRSNLPRFSANPDEVTLRRSNPSVLGLEIREDVNGRKHAYVIGLKPGTSTLSARHNGHPAARSAIVVQVK